MSSRRRADKKVEPGIYDLGGTHDGHPVLGAYDRAGELEVAYGPDAYGQLEVWLRQRGTILSSRPALFLVRSLALFALLG